MDISGKMVLKDIIWNIFGPPPQTCNAVHACPRDAKFQNWLGVRPCEGAERPRGCPPSHGRELFHFGVRNCAIWCIPIIQFYLHNYYGFGGRLADGFGGRLADGFGGRLADEFEVLPTEGLAGRTSELVARPTEGLPGGLTVGLPLGLVSMGETFLSFCQTEIKTTFNKQVCGAMFG